MLRDRKRQEHWQTGGAEPTMHELYLENANLRHARHPIASWRDDYNLHRPHSSVDGLTPQEYHQRSTEDQTLNSAKL